MKSKSRPLSFSTADETADRKHERAIQAAGLLHYLLASGLALAAITGVALHRWKGALPWSDTLWVGGVFLVFAGLLSIVGHGFHRLKAWAGFASGGLALLCLMSLILNPEVRHPLVLSIAVIRNFALPVGIIITLYGAYLTLFAKGKRVLASDYRTAVVNRPEMQLALSKPFLAAGLLLSTAQSLKVLMIFIARAH